jgi:peptidoglycan hydrolase CwlO-like protein
MGHREVHLDMRTNESAELAMRVKALESDVAALQQRVKALNELLHDAVRAMTEDQRRVMRAGGSGS